MKATKQAVLELRADGTVAALSSDGASIYTVRLNPLECTCKGFANHGHCYHATQAFERFGRFPRQPEPVRMPQAERRAIMTALYPEAA